MHGRRLQRNMNHYSKKYCKDKELILFLLTRSNPSPGVISHASTMIKNNVDSVFLESIKDLAISNGTASIVYKNLKQVDSMPRNIMDSLKNAYLVTIKNNAENIHEMFRILKILSRNRIKVIPLKGAISSEVIFGDLGLYPSSDIDILVSPEDIPKAEELLFEDGYSKAEGLCEADLLSNHYHLIFRKGIYTIELHWNLVKRYFYIPAEFWWQETWETVHEGMEITMLSHERYLMYAIFRLFDHGFRPLKFFVLIAGIIEKYRNDIDWQKLLYFAKEYRMQRLFLFTLKLINYMFDTDIPEHIIKRRIFAYQLIKKQVVRGIFNEEKRPHLKMLFYTCLLESPCDFFANLFKRMFPKFSEIRLRYGISANSKKVYMYYLLNPLLIFLKKRGYN